MILNLRTTTILGSVICALMLLNCEILHGQITTGHSQNFDLDPDAGADSSWEDLSGSGENWTFSGSTVVTYNANPTTTLSGINNAYVFPANANNGNNKASLNGYQNILGDPTKSSASFELWFRPTNLSGGDQTLWESGDTTGSSLTITGGSTLQWVSRGGGEFISTTSLTDLEDEFIQAFATIDMTNDEFQLYVNGRQVATLSTSITDWSGGDNSGLGGTQGNGTGGRGGTAGNMSFYAFDGEIAIHRFYESTLTPAQVQANYLAVAGTEVEFDGSVDSSWDVAANWDQNAQPFGSQNVIIGAGDSVVVPASPTVPAEANNLTINDGGSVSGAGVIDVNGNLINTSGTGTLSAGLNFAGASGTQELSVSDTLRLATPSPITTSGSDIATTGIGTLEIGDDPAMAFAQSIVGNFDHQSGTLAFDVIDSLNADMLSVTGDVTLGGTVAVNFSDGLIGDEVYDLISAGSFLTPLEDIDFLFAGGPEDFMPTAEFTNGGTVLQVSFDPTSVPEPSTLLLAAFGLVGLAWAGLRKRK